MNKLSKTWEAILPDLIERVPNPVCIAVSDIDGNIYVTYSGKKGHPLLALLGARLIHTAATDFELKDEFSIAIKKDN